MIPVAKHGDPQIGVDIHLCVVPPSPSPVPLPTPHMSVVFDPMDYVPFFGATVTVCGMKRAVAGTAGQTVHIPPGFPFAPKLPDKDDEIFMGSATVVADGDPLSFLGVPVLACQAVGMPSPPRPKRKGGPRVMTLPTVSNLAIPTNVFVGGPPTISLMGMAFKLGFAGLGKLGKTKWAQGLAERFRDWRKAKFGHLNPGFLKCGILRAEPVNIVTGAVSVEQEDFTLPGLIPVRWTRRYASDNPRRGALGHGWECPADARLEHDAESGVVLFRHPEGGIAIFPALPAAEGEAAAVLELMDGALLSDHGAEFRVRTKEDRVYAFPKALGHDAGEGEREYPLGWVQDLCGNALVYERVAGRLVAIREGAGRVILLEGDEDGAIRRVALHVPETGFRHVFVEYERDAAGDLVEVRDALGNPYRFAYDTHHMVRHTDRNGLSFYYQYDGPGPVRRVVRSWGDGGLYAYRFAYLDAVNERRITDSLGHVSLVTLDGRGLPIREVDPIGGVTIYEYDEGGRTTAVVTPGQLRTSLSYDERGNLLELTNPDGTGSHWTYDGNSRKVETVDAGGGTWRQRWNELGKLIERVGPAGTIDRYTYDGNGQLSAHRDALDRITRLSLDSYGGLREIIDAALRRTSFDTDPLGRLTAKREPSGATTSYEYDARGQVTSVVYPSGRSIKVEYDREGNVAATVEPDGSRTQFRYLGLGSMSARIAADGSLVQYEYDTEERLIRIIDPEGRQHRYIRDALGRVVGEIDYWGGRTGYSHDDRGFIARMTNGAGEGVTFGVDDLGRIVRRTAENGVTDEYAYDPAGRLVSARNDWSRVEREFDPEGRMLVERQNEFEVRFGFDLAGNCVRRQAAGGAEIKYGYDDCRLLRAISVNQERCLDIGRDAEGRRSRETFFGEQSRLYAYDGDGLLSGTDYGGGRARPFAIKYDRDGNGRITGRTDPAFGRDVFSYDPVGRILRHTEPSGLTHDFLGHDNEAVGENARSRIRGTRTYRYDQAGRVTEVVDDGETITLRWDAVGRLLASTRAGETTLYQYDAIGRRTRKSGPSGSTSFVWDHGSLLGERSDEQGEGGLFREYVNYPGSFEPVLIVQPGKAKAGGAEGSAPQAILAVQADPNGFPVRLIGADGEVAWSARYDAWGQARTSVALVDPKLRFQGQYFDDETGLHYNRHRYYDPHIGEFVSKDPLGLAGGVNVYEYAPDAINWVDPSGLNCSQFDELAKLRSELGLPSTGNRKTDGVLTKLEINGKGYFGINSWAGSDAAARAEFQKAGLLTSTGKVPHGAFANHAEGDAFLQAFKDSGKSSGGTGKLFVDSDVCGFCESNLKSTAQSLGLDQLEVWEKGATAPRIIKP